MKRKKVLKEVAESEGSGFEAHRLDRTKLPVGNAGGFTRPSEIHFSGLPRPERPLRQLPSTSRWKRIMKREKVLKEVAKSIPILHQVLSWDNLKGFKNFCA